YKGNVRHEMVGAIFSQYDAFLFPTKSENYGHVISESLLNDCPVIISDKTPWNDIENGEEGYVCSLDNVEEFRRAIKELYYKDEKEHLLMKKKIKNYMESKVDFSKFKNEISTKIEKIIRK
ncbi:glycosyltransferase, partial [Enterococcus spodopteracolus]